MVPFLFLFYKGKGQALFARNKENVEYWKVYEERVMNRCY